MVKVLAVLLLTFTLGAFLFYPRHGEEPSRSAESQTPAEAVSSYCRLAEQGDFEQLKNYTTVVPDKYWEYEMQKVKQAESEEDSSKTDSKKSSQPKTSLSIVPAGNTYPISMVNNSFPAILFERKEGLKRITQTFIKDDEARVIAVIGFRGVEKDGEEWEFFLHKENQKWLIFMVTLQSGTELYAKP